MDHDQADKLRNNSSEIAEILSALSHESRLFALSFLIDGEKELKFLIEKTGLSKNGLVNHLSTLMDAGLVERVSRGKYRLTKDGAGYVSDMVDQYLVSERYRAKRQRIDTTMYQWRIQTVDEKIVSNPAEFKPSWFSYQGAVQGVLNSHGVEIGLTEVVAVSGYGWITNAMKKHLCPSAPSAFHSDVWSNIYNATEALGYKIEVIKSGIFEWDENQKPTPDSAKNADKQYKAVKKEINADRPVVMWGIPIPEYGIVNGYRGEEYIVSTFRRLLEQPDTPIHYTGLMAPGGLCILRFTEPIQTDPKQVAAETLKLGYKLGTGDVPQIPEYVLGPEAYDVLANNLTEEPLDENSHHGTGYTLACLMEGKHCVKEYLKKINPLINVELVGISEKYSTVYQILNKCHEIFPLGPGEMPEKNRIETADYLRQAKKIEVDALEDLQIVLEAI